MGESMKTVYKYLIGVLAALIVTSAIIVPVLLIEYGIINPHPNTLVDHDPIVIWKNEDFLDYNFKGTGTQEDPYLLQWLNITTITSNAIYIFGVTNYFIIQNCFLKTSHLDGIAIHLENVDEGLAIITNNTIVDSDTGLFLSNTDKTQVIQNKFESCQYAISLTSADLTTLYQNAFVNPDEIFFYHMFASNSYRLNVTENVFEGENSIINIDHCESSKFVKNHLVNASFYILYTHNCLISNNTGVNFNILLFYSPHSNLTSNEGQSLTTFQSPNSRLEYNQFESYSLRELSIEDYASYYCHSNRAGEGLFSLIVSSEFIDLGSSLTINSQVTMVNCTSVWLIGFISCIFDSVRIEFVFSSEIEIMHSSWAISFYFKESNNVMFYNTSLMEFYADNSNNYLLQNNTFSNTDVYCSYMQNIEIKENNFLMSELSLVETTDTYVFNNYFYDGEIDSYHNVNESLVSNVFENCAYGFTDSTSDEIFLLENIFTETYDIGPRFIQTSRLTFVNNSIFGNQSGFTLLSGISLITEYIFDNNTVNSKPLGFFKDQDNLIIANQSFGQLILVNCSNAQISDITVKNTSIALTVYDSPNSNISKAVIEYSYEGIRLILSEQSILQEVSVSNCSNIGLNLESSSNSDIVDSSFYKNLLGIYLASSDHSNLVNNTCYDNTDGLKIYSSDFIIIRNNTFRDNLNRGILTSAANHGCNITYNLFENNLGYAIEILSLSYGNHIHHNAFINNNPEGTSQAMDRSGLSTWYDELTTTGNYWNTWIGVGSYPIDYMERSVADLYPLSSNPLD